MVWRMVLPWFIWKVGLIDVQSSCKQIETLTGIEQMVYNKRMRDLTLCRQILMLD